MKDSHLCPEIKATAKMVKNPQRAGDIQNNHFQRAPSPSLVTIWRLFVIFAKPFASSSPTRAFLDISPDSDRISKMTSSCKWPVGWYSYLNQKNQNKQHNRLNEKIQRHLTDTRSLPVQAMISVFYIWQFASETSPSEKNTRFCY